MHKMIKTAGNMLHKSTTCLLSYDL